MIAKFAGKVTITATSMDGISESIDLNVSLPDSVVGAGVCLVGGALALSIWKRSTEKDKTHKRHKEGI